MGRGGVRTNGAGGGEGEGVEGLGLRRASGGGVN